MRGAVAVEALLAAGVRDVVLAPGSRSAPLALALAAAERRGALRLHVRIDERSAGYLALGLAKGTPGDRMAPVAVVTTSGTAAINLHPAVVEASYGGVPLIALTADRPARLRGVGAHQTIAQVGIYAGEVRFELDLVDAGATREPDHTANSILQAIRTAVDPVNPGPVHVNIAFDEPLVDSGFDPARHQHDAGRTMDRTFEKADASDIGLARDAEQDSWSRLLAVPHGLIIVGDTAGLPAGAVGADRIAELSLSTGWPIVAEPSASAANLPEALAHGSLLLGDPHFMAEGRPEIVVSIGRIGLHRSVMRLLPSVSHHIVVDPRPAGLRCDPLGTATFIARALPEALSGTRGSGEWIERWRRADESLERQFRDFFDRQESLSGPLVARMVVDALSADDLFVLGPSWPMRHSAEFAARLPARCIANRGTSGIDGVVSTAWGAAMTHGGHTVALLGDLTAIYDRNGLLRAPGEVAPHLTYVVIDNDGGGIFSSLEQSDEAFAIDFERVFGTPHGDDLGLLLAGSGVEVVTVHTPDALAQALSQARLTARARIIIARCVERSVEADVVAKLRGFIS